MFTSRHLVRRVCIYSKNLFAIRQRQRTKFDASAIKYFSCTHRLNCSPTAATNGNSLKNKIEGLRKFARKSGNLPSLQVLHDVLTDIDRGEEISPEDALFLISSYESMIGRCIRAGDLSTAIELYSRAVAKLPTFTLDQRDGLVMLRFLFETSRAKDAIELVTHIREGQASEDLAIKWETFLKEIGRWCTDSEIEQLYAELLSRNVFVVNGRILAPLINRHLSGGSWEKAVQLFYHFSATYSVTPCLTNLLIKLIENKEVEHLERVVTITLRLHGKRSLHELAGAFIECNRLVEAQNIFKKLGSTCQMPALQSKADHFYETGKDECLERLHHAVGDHVHVDDRKYILDKLLMARCRRSDPPDEILSFCDEIASQPSTECLKHLEYYLKKQNRLLPDKWMESVKMPILKVDSKSMLQEAINTTEKMDVAKKAIFEAVESGGEIRFDRKELRYFLSTSEKNGDIDTFDKLRPKLDEHTKKHLLFSKYDCRAHIAANRCHKYLDYLNEQAIAANTNTKKMQLSKIFPLQAYEILEKFPDMCDEFEEMAMHYAKKNVLKPMCLLWLHHFCRNNADVCYRLHENHQLPDAILCKLGAILFLTRKDAARLTALTQTLDTKEIPKQVLAKLYENLLETLLHHNQHNQIAITLKNARNVVSMRYIREETLDKIRFGGKDLAEARTILMSKSK